MKKSQRKIGGKTVASLATVFGLLAVASTTTILMVGKEEKIESKDGEISSLNEELSSMQEKLEGQAI